jgi:hypothetical protein
MTDRDPSAEIRYTTDGSLPTPKSTLYNGPLTVSLIAREPQPMKVTVNAQAFRAGFTPSDITTVTYSTSPPPPPKLPAPAISPLDVTKLQPEVTVQMTDRDPSAEIRYTTDGSLPTPKSTLYNGPFKVSLLAGEFQPIKATVNAQAFRAGFTPSDVTSVTYSP